MTDNEKNSVSKLSYGDKFLIFVPNEGNYIEILGHRIDGFESFEAFCEHLKKYAELEETVKSQKAVIDRQKDHIELLEIEKQTLKEDSDKAKATAVGVIKRLDTEIERLKEKLNHSIGVDNTKENGCFPFD